MLNAQPEISDEKILGDGIWKDCLFRAARAAALASSGEGQDGGALDDEERTRWRQQALAWLKHDLAVWNKAVQEGREPKKYTMKRALRIRMLHPDFEGLRNPDALASLPDDEREAFEEYWSGVGVLLEPSK